MATLLYLNQYVTTTLSQAGGIDNSTTTGIVLASTDNLDTSKPGIALLTYADPLDTSVAEWVEYSSINSSTKALQGVVRGSEGFSAKSHDNGAAIAFPLSESHVNRIANKLTGNDATAIADPNGNEILKTGYNASAVNEVTIKNAATGAEPSVEATGGDTKIAVHYKGKSSFNLHSGIRDLGTVGATETVDWNNGDRQKMTLDENVTISFSNATEGQTVTLYMLQDGTGTNTITFADTISWSEGTTPTWTTTADDMNIAVISYVGSAYYGVGNSFS